MDSEKINKRIFSVLFIAIFSTMLGLGIIGPLMPSFARDLGASGIWLGIFFASFSLSRAIFTPLIGRISDKKGRKRFIVIGLLIYTILSFLYILAQNIYSLSFIRFIHGLASAMVIPIAMAYIGETTKKGSEGKKMGFFSVAFYLGMGTGPLIGGILHDKYGMNAVFIAMGIFTALAFILTLFLLPDINFSKSKGSKSLDKSKFKQLFKNKLFIGILIYRFITALGRGGVMAFLPLLAERVNISASNVGIILTTNILLMGLLQIFTGHMADKHNKFYLVIIGALLAALPLLTLPIAKNFWTFLLLTLFMGFGGAISMPAASAINIKIGKNYGMGTTTGLFSMAMSFGMIIAPIFSGIIMDSLGIKYVFYFGGLITLLGIGTFYLFIKEGLKVEENRTYA